MIQNKTRHAQAHLIFSSQHVHSKKVDIRTFDLHAILRSSLKLFADMNGVPSSPIWHLRSTSPLQRTRLNELFWSMKKLCQSSVRRVFRKQFCHLHPKRFLLGWPFNDYLTNSRKLVPWNLSRQHPTGRGLGPKGQIDRVENFFMVHPDARLTEQRSSNIGFRAVWKTVLLFRYLSQASIGVQREELFDLVDLFLRPRAFS